jgi:uncharacterized protein (DUF952 family)
MARLAGCARRKVQKTLEQKEPKNLIFYHITTPAQWAKFDDEDFYEAESLTTEGFIHASFAGQLEETLKIHYKNVREVLIFTVDADLLTSRLVVEKSRNGEDFPHIYGTINKSAITAIEERILHNGNSR